MKATTTQKMKKNIACLKNNVEVTWYKFFMLGFLSKKDVDVNAHKLWNVIFVIVV